MEFCYFFFFKQKTAYEMRISDWSSDVCSSDLNTEFGVATMLVLGIIAYLMEENAFPVAPIILGMVLGPMLEENFINSMQKTGGDPIGFVRRPIAGILALLTILIWTSPLWLRLLRGRRLSPLRAGG